MRHTFPLPGRSWIEPHSLYKEKQWLKPSTFHASIAADHLASPITRPSIARSWSGFGSCWTDLYHPFRDHVEMDLLVLCPCHCSPLSSALCEGEWTRKEYSGGILIQSLLPVHGIYVLWEIVELGGFLWTAILSCNDLVNKIWRLRCVSLKVRQFCLRPTDSLENQA